jgi:two-component system response regulator
MNNSPDIILVEDNPHDAELAIHALKKHNLSNRMIHLKDGQEALDYLLLKEVDASEQPPLPKVVLLDLKLPKIDGLEVLRQLRGNPRTHLLPIVVLTSSREERDVIESYNLGANSYIVKPVEFEKFSEAVGQLGFYWVLLNEGPVTGKKS